MKKKCISMCLVAIFLLVGCSTNKIIKTEDIDPNKVINIKDVELNKLVREQINKPEGDILASDMEQVYSISINFKETPVLSLDGLEYATKLHDFSYRYGDSLESLNPISNIQTLEYLSISYSKIDNKPSSFNTPSLERVSFIETNIKDYDFLKNSTLMTDLYLVRNDITSIELLTNMNDLKSLDLNDNKITDLSSLKNKKKLTYITLHQNEIKDISVLATCDNLEEINISYNHVTNIEPLYKLEKLTQITAYEELDAKIISRSQIETLIASGVNVDYHK
ncbi:MAG: leucine-rich repeat domain-containing protein [Bacilli bacterium]|nr:leucine-rich repeat domain-containing protein [Bacilli bacterium]